MNKRKIIYILQDNKISQGILKLIQSYINIGYNIVITINNKNEDAEYRLCGKPGEVKTIHISDINIHNFNINLNKADIILNFTETKIMDNEIINHCNNFKKKYIKIIYTGDLKEKINIKSSYNESSSVINIYHSYIYGMYDSDIQNSINFYSIFRSAILSNTDHIVAPIYSYDFVEALVRITQLQKVSNNIILKGKEMKMSEFINILTEFLNKKIFIFKMPKKLINLKHKCLYPIYRTSYQWRHLLCDGDKSNYVSGDLIEFNALKLPAMNSIKTNLRTLLKDMYDYKEVKSVGLQ